MTERKNLQNVERNTSIFPYICMYGKFNNIEIENVPFYCKKSTTGFAINPAVFCEFHARVCIILPG
jgi:hypothetical protein